MDSRLQGKAFSFIGLFFLASISLHSFAHIEDNFTEVFPQIECQSCHSDTSSDVQLFSYIQEEFETGFIGFEFSQDYYPRLKKSFNSQAPPKIKI